ncbi:MAG: hypothetical protein ACHRXM_34540, partial [Isosphaerales bacterium]
MSRLPPRWARLCDRSGKTINRQDAKIAKKESEERRGQGFLNPRVERGRTANPKGIPVFSPPPLKFRTAGFPQYGFKQEFNRDLHRYA